MSAPANEQRSTRWLLAVAGLSLVASGVLGVLGGQVGEASSAGADAFSRSALGHHAFTELLRELGYEVVLSRHDTFRRAGLRSVVVVAEPQVAAEGRSTGKLERIAATAGRMLLVLPKRTGKPFDRRPAWLAETGKRSIEEAQRALDTVLRTRLDDEERPRKKAEQASHPPPTIEAHVVRGVPLPAASSFGPAPVLTELQLISGTALKPLIGTTGAMLAGLLEGADGEKLVVISDPDLLANHGLGKGENAALVVQLLEKLAAPGEQLVFDETLHGFEQEPSLVLEALRAPIVFATAQAVILLLLLAWAAVIRFGRAQAAQPPLAPGKAFLIDNTAALLRHGGHVAPALAAYWRVAKEQLARALRGPAERSDALDEWLASRAASRGREDELRELERRVWAFTPASSAAEAVRIGRLIHRFREEMIDGPAEHP
jgi:hypothetical protein